MYESSCMNFHIFTCTPHLLRVYYELTKWPAPSGLITQLVEHCTGIAEVMGSNPVQAWIFSGDCLSCVHNCDDQTCLHNIRHVLIQFVLFYRWRIRKTSVVAAEKLHALYIAVNLL